MPEPFDTNDPIEDSSFLKNIAADIDAEELKKIGNTVVEDYKTDVASRSVWEDRIKNWYTLFAGLVEQKNKPWENCSNVNIPIMSTACLQFQAREYEALLPPKEIAKFYATDGAAVDEAARCQKFLNWQLTEQMEEWEEDMDVTLLMLPIFGVSVKKTYFDATLKRPVSVVLRTNEFVAPYGVKRLEDAPRKTHVYESYLNDIRIKGRDKAWINTKEIGTQSPSVQGIELAQEYKEASDEATGVSNTLEDKDRPRVILEQHRTWDVDGDGIEEPYIITVDKETSTVLRIESLSYDDPITNTVKVREYFTPYIFIPNPDSWMGFGFGHLLEHLNHSANSLINQLIDAGTLSNNISGLFNRRANIKNGDLSFEMGELKGVDAATDDIRKAIYTFDFKQPSTVLFSLLQMVQNYAKELSSVTEAMMGKLPPSDTTATSMLTVMEQGLKVFSTIHKRTHRGLKKELKKISALNAMYLDETVYFAVQDSTSSEIQTLRSGRQDFLKKIDVIPISDPTITSRAEKLIRSRQAYELGMQNPDIQQDPLARYELTKNLLEALEVQNIGKILKKPEPPPPPPDLRPEEEEAEFLAERDVRPLPHQDHLQHFESHQTFTEDPEWFGRLTPQGKKLLEAHTRETLALLYLQQAQQEEGQDAEIAGGVPGVVA
jgi:chaperonin GroES